MSLTRDLAGFIADVDFKRLPSAAAEVVALGFTDCVGTMIAGRSDPAVTVARSVFLPLVKGCGASLCFTSERAPAPIAVLINGTAAHALDYDDVALLGHPSAVLVPAILAEAEELDAPGSAMVAAYVAGYETWAELLSREGKGYRAKGWHPTAVFGAVAAAAACAVLRRLGPQDAAHALGIAASRASGLAANFGSMTKPLHVGQAAQSGVLAARLAAAGMTASVDVLEHPQGFLSAISPTGAPDRDRPAGRLGQVWQIEKRGLSVKRYPVCYAVHRIIDATLQVRSASPFKTEDVSRVTAFMSRAQAVMLRHSRPMTALQAKFSAEFGVAAAILAGRVGLAELSDSFVARADVQNLVHIVHRDVHETYDPELPDYSPFDRVVVEFTSGAVLKSEAVRRPRGHVSNPLSADELQAKFEDCVADALPTERRQVLFRQLQSIHALSSARVLTADTR